MYKLKFCVFMGGVNVLIVFKGVFYKFGIIYIVNVSEIRVIKKWVIFILLLLLL